MGVPRFGGWIMTLAFVAGAAVVMPALGAPGTRIDRRPAAAQRAPIRALSHFTPAAADPRLIASLTRAGALGGSFRFTPSGATRGGSRAVTVAVRSGGATGGRAALADRTALAASPAGLNPVAYDLGVSVGWRRFALSGDVKTVDLGALPGGRQQVDVGVSYSAPRWTARLQAGRDAPVATTPRLASEPPGYSVDLGGSYRLTRNLDVTAGVRYRRDQDRLDIRQDDRRDSQAVYVGTAFRF